MTPELLTAAVVHAQTHPEEVVDFLLEHQATLLEVLLTFAGTPPDFADGLPQECLAEWLSRSGDGERFDKVRKCHVLEIGELNVSWCAYIWEYPEYYTLWSTEADARRYLKRRILGLFPEVVYVFKSERLRPVPPGAQISDRYLAEVFPRCRPDLNYSTGKTSVRYPRNVIYVDRRMQHICQELAAPDWIPPSEEERRRNHGPSPIRAAFGPYPLSPDFAALSAAVARTDALIAEVERLSRAAHFGYPASPLPHPPPRQCR